MPNLVRLVYISEAAVPFPPASLAELLRHAQARNAARGLTGLLLFAGGHFIQVLEGSAEAVTERFDVIAADPRHRRVSRLLCEVTTRRLFGGWSMASLSFDALAPLDRGRLRSVVQWADDPTAATGRTQVHKLLQNFSEQLAPPPHAAPAADAA